MQISETQIKRYQEIHLEEYGFDIDEAKAIQELRSLVYFIDAVHRYQNNHHEPYTNNESS